MKLVYDELVIVARPLYVCLVCRAESYEEHCTDHSNCEMHYGPAQVGRVMDIAEAYGPDCKWHGISLNMLLEARDAD